MNRISPPRIHAPQGMEPSGERSRHDAGRRRCQGFTLLELLLATVIASLVIGIMAASLSFSLRLWSRTQWDPAVSKTPVLELLKWQILSFYALDLPQEGGSGPLFSGDGRELVFATTYSPAAIGRGAPVAVRYVFDPSAGKLYYGETPLNPYEPEVLESLREKAPNDSDGEPRFYAFDAHRVAFAYLGRDSDDFEETWEDAGVRPEVVLVTVQWNEDEEETTLRLVPGLLFFPSR